MKLTISSITDKGDAQKERLLLRVLADIDVGDYAIFRTIIRDGQATAAVEKVFWFPTKHVGAGDMVVLYSRQGVDKDRAQKGGGTVHFFYWDQDEPQWMDADFAPVLVHTPNWEVYVGP